MTEIESKLLKLIFDETEDTEVAKFLEKHADTLIDEVPTKEFVTELVDQGGVFPLCLLGVKMGLLSEGFLDAEQEYLSLRIKELTRE